jgi:hypothetical protein
MPKRPFPPALLYRIMLMSDIFRRFREARKEAATRRPIGQTGGVDRPWWLPRYDMYVHHV